MQTVAAFLLPRRLHLPEAEARLIEVAHDVKVLCHCHWQPDRSKALTIIVVHGLEGSSDSQYARGIAEKGLRAGMNVIRYNQRNCGGTEALAPVLYHSGLSGDIAAVARELIARDKVSRLALVGFSMGGNLVLKLAGEWGKHAPPEFRAVAACCPALDLAASADALHEPANRIYEAYFLWALRRRMLRKARLFPEHFDTSPDARPAQLARVRRQGDGLLLRFQSVDDYYDRASATHTVGQIAVPTLVLQAATDPFIRITPGTREKILANPNIKFFEAADGGHCAFVGARSATTGSGRVSPTMVTGLRARL